MNLVAKEYIATRTDQTGVLILSEMAGAFHEMNEALIINPNDFDQIASAIHQAIKMPKEEQVRRNTVLQKRLKRYSVEKWADDFMSALEKTKEIKPAFKAVRINEEVEDKILKRFQNAKNRILSGL
jgi:trehalose 6-phosphate synthase/phosphatase